MANSIERGKQLYQTCAACHGASAQGNEAVKAPALAGQYDWYTKRQINNIKIGLRGTHPQDNLAKQMRPFVAKLSDDEITHLAKYISSLASTPVAQTLTGNEKNGFRYYQGKCGACHGDTGQGNKAFNAPKLTGLSSEYLQRQMSNFSTGIRGAHQDDKLGRQMAMMAKMTSGQELQDILFYLQLQSK